MPSEVQFQAESSPGREQIAEFFVETVAYHLRRGDSIPVGAKGDALIAGDEYVTPTPPANPTFEITVQRVGSADSPGTKSIEFRLVWDEADEE